MQSLVQGEEHEKRGELAAAEYYYSLSAASLPAGPDRDRAATSAARVRGALLPNNTNTNNNNHNHNNINLHNNHQRNEVNESQLTESESEYEGAERAQRGADSSGAEWEGIREMREALTRSEMDRARLNGELAALRRRALARIEVLLERNRELEDSCRILEHEKNVALGRAERRASGSAAGTPDRRTSEGGGAPGTPADHAAAISRLKEELAKLRQENATLVVRLASARPAPQSATASTSPVPRATADIGVMTVPEYVEPEPVREPQRALPRKPNVVKVSVDAAALMAASSLRSSSLGAASNESQSLLGSDLFMSALGGGSVDQSKS
jgi:hypothetical protein